MVPHDKRFEMVRANFSILSHNRDLGVTPELSKYLPRPELFQLKKKQLQYDTNPELHQMKNLSLGVPDFSRYTNRKVNSNARPYPLPDSYDNTLIERGRQLLSDYKEPVNAIQMDKN